MRIPYHFELPVKPSTFASGYVALLPLLSKAANDCGYALGVHGTLARDLDLIAAPWTDAAVDPDALIAALCAACGACVPDYVTRVDGSIAAQPQHKPHGRLGWSLHLGGGPYIDVSVLPLAQAASFTPQTIDELPGNEQRYGPRPGQSEFGMSRSS